MRVGSLRMGLRFEPVLGIRYQEVSGAYKQIQAGQKKRRIKVKVKIEIEVEDRLPELKDKTVAMTVAYLRFKAEEFEGMTGSAICEELDSTGEFGVRIARTIPDNAWDVRDLWFLHEEVLTEAHRNGDNVDDPLSGLGRDAVYSLIREMAHRFAYDCGAVIVHNKNSEERKEDGK